MCGHDCGQTEFVQEGGENCFSITTTTALPINNQQDVPSPPFKRSYRLVPNSTFTHNSIFGVARVSSFGRGYLLYFDLLTKMFNASFTIKTVSF